MLCLCEGSVVVEGCVLCAWVRGAVSGGALQMHSRRWFPLILKGPKGGAHKGQGEAPESTALLQVSALFRPRTAPRALRLAGGHRGSSPCTPRASSRLAMWSD